MWWIAVAVAGEPQSMTLDEALDVLASEGPAVAQAQARVDVARGVARQVSAAWLPVVNATGTYTRNDDEVVLSFGQLLGQLGIPLDPAPPDTVIQPLEVFNGAVTARVPLLAASAWADSRASNRQVDAAGASALEARNELEAAVVAAAASVEAAEGVVTAADRAVDVAIAHARSTTIAQAAGTATRVDTLAADAEVARRRSEALVAKSTRDAALDAAGALLGRDGPVRIVLPDAPPPASSPDGRPALVAAEANVRAAQAKVSSAWLRHVPTVSATGLAQAATVPYATGNDSQWRVGLEATWSAYDGGLRYGRLTQARAELALAEATLRAEELRTSKEVRDAERDLAVAREHVALSEEQARLAAEAASVAEKGLAAGTTSPLLARDVEQQAFAAEVGVVGARARLRIAEAQWRRAGGLGQRW